MPIALYLTCSTISVILYHATLFFYRPQISNVEQLYRNIKSTLILYYSKSQVSWDLLAAASF